MNPNEFKAEHYYLLKYRNHLGSRYKYNTMIFKVLEDSNTIDVIYDSDDPRFNWVDCNHLTTEDIRKLIMGRKYVYEEGTIIKELDNLDILKIVPELL